MPADPMHCPACGVVLWARAPKLRAVYDICVREGRLVSRLVAEERGCSPQSAFNSMAALERMGLVARDGEEPAPSGGRQIVWRLRTASEL